MSTITSATESGIDPPQARHRLDDLFRQIVHTRPDVVFDLVTPDLVDGRQGADGFVRLDTQLLLIRYLPDAAYLINAPPRRAVVVLEGQGKARPSAPERTSMIAADFFALMPHAEPEFEFHLLEVRTRQRSLLAGRTPASNPGRLRFVPLNILLELEPDDSRFLNPRTWCLLAFSQHVGPELLERLIIESSELHHPRHPLRHRIDSMDTHLLGAVSRARFPEYPWSQRAQEAIVKGVQTIESADAGFLTKKERRDINIEAWQQAGLELDKMKADGEARGEAKGRRAVLLELAERLSPGRTNHYQGIESLDELERVVWALLS